MGRNPLLLLPPPPLAAPDRWLVLLPGVQVGCCTVGGRLRGGGVESGRWSLRSLSGSDGAPDGAPVDASGVAPQPRLSAAGAPLLLLLLLPLRPAHAGPKLPLGGVAVAALLGVVEADGGEERTRGREAAEDAEWGDTCCAIMLP